MCDLVIRNGTIVDGKVAFRNGEHTGVLGGRLLRSTAGDVQ